MMSGAIDKAALASTFGCAGTVIVTTIDPVGRMCSRPLPLVNTDSDGSLWLMVNRAAQHCINLASNPHVSVVSARPGQGAYAAVSGQAHIRDDPDLVRGMWRDAYRCWFAAGVDGSHLSLLCVIPEEIRSWTGLPPEDGHA